MADTVLTVKQLNNGDLSKYSHIPPGFNEAANGTCLTKKDDETIEWATATPVTGETVADVATGSGSATFTDGLLSAFTAGEGYTGTIITAADGTFEFVKGILMDYTAPA